MREEFGEEVRDRDCVCDWLKGQQLSGDEASCFCWESDPFPTEDFPDKLMSERRYFHYRYIAKILGGMARLNVPSCPRACVLKRIAKMYPDAEGTATKVGYKQEKEE